MTTLYREIDALGGVFDPRDERALGRVEQLGTVLDILIKLGFTEEADAKPPCYDRLVALAERMAETGYDTGMVSEARAIMAELRPVDPDLIEARALAAQADCVPAWRDECLSGKHDEAMSVRARLQGIKRGRALAESGK